MPVTASYTPNVSVGNGVTTVFPYTFRILDADDLLVQLDGVSTTSGYTVSGVGDSGGGNVTFSVAPTSGVEVLRARNVPYDRETDYQHNGDLLEETLDADLDRIVMQVQQIRVDMDRAPMLPLGNALAGSVTLPVPGAGKFLRWNAGGTNLEAADAVYDNGTYLASGTGAVERTVDAKLGELVTPMDYGAAGDGVTDDTDAIQAAIDAGAPVIDGRGLTYKVSETLTLRSNLELCNFDIDFTDAAVDDVLFYASGSTGTANLLTANRSRLSLSLPVTSAGLVAGDYVLAGSTANYESNTSTKVGEITRIASVSGLTCNLRDATHSAYNTADTASAKKLTFVENITLRNVRATGAGDGTTAGGQDQYGARFIVCRNVQLIDCDFQAFDYAAVEFATCLYARVRGGYFGNAHDSTDGASYGVMLTHGTHHATIEGATFYDQRHGVTTGGTTAVNRHITVTGCTAIGCRAAGIDNHAGTEIYTWTGNTISAEVGNLTSGTQAALQSLGGAGVISGNVIRGSYEHGILCQIFPLGIQCPLVISSNLLDNGSSTDSDHIGVFVEQRNNATNSGIVISDNVLSDGWQTGIMIEADAADIKYITVAGNNLGLVKSRGIYLNAPTGRLIEHGSIANNSMRVDAGGSENIMLNSTDAGGIEFFTVTGNTCYAGTYGIRGVNTDRIAAAPNVCIGASVSQITVAGANSKTDGTNVTA